MALHVDVLIRLASLVDYNFGFAVSYLRLYDPPTAPKEKKMSNLPPGAPGLHLTFLCDRTLVGCIIGKQGVTVRGLQLYADVVIDIDQRRDPSQIVFSGE
jgi:hypothetical protein